MPAVVMGDTIAGTCAIHQIPSPSGPVPAGPLPFAAKLTDGLAQKVTIGGKPAAVFTSSGYNAPPHPGIVDPPYATPTNQLGSITSGSATVMIEGKPAATTASSTMCCAAPGMAVGPGVPTVLIG